jgi:hypothetical protein
MQKESTFKGKKIRYDENSRFLIQIGKDDKGSYETIAQITGDFEKALEYYREPHIQNAYKQRIICDSLTPRRIVYGTL